MSHAVGTVLGLIVSLILCALWMYGAMFWWLSASEVRTRRGKMLFLFCLGVLVGAIFGGTRFPRS